MGRDTSAAHGEQGMAGAELALADLRASGQKINVKYIVEDTHSKPADAVSATQKLINVDKAKVITGWLSSSDALAIAPICERQGVLFLATGTSTPQLSGAGRYIFRHALLSPPQARLAVDFMIKGVKAKRIGLIYENDNTGLGYRQAFEGAMQERNAKIIDIETYEKSATDFRAQITKLKASRCDAVYVVGVPGTIGYILKQSRELGFSPKMVSNMGAEGQELFDIAGDAANGLVFTTVAISPQFSKKYQARFNKPPQMLTAIAYDSMIILFNALRNTDGTPGSIASYLSIMKSQSGASGSIEFDSSHDAVKKIAFKKVENGRFVSMEWATQ